MGGNTFSIPTFYQTHIFVVRALENITCRVNKEDCGDEFTDVVWDPKTRRDASALLTSLTSFDFINTFLANYEFLSHLSGITVKLQISSVDIISSYAQISEVKLSYQALSRDVDVAFQRIFQHAERVADELNIQPSNHLCHGLQGDTFIVATILQNFR